MRPLLRVLAVVLGLPHGRAGDLAREAVEGVDEVVQRGVLASGSQTIGEDLQWRIEFMGCGRSGIGESGGHGCVDDDAGSEQDGEKNFLSIELLSMRLGYKALFMVF